MDMEKAAKNDSTLPIRVITGSGQLLSDTDPAEVRRLIETDGTLLMRGFDTTLGSFARLGEILCSNAMFNESPNREILSNEDLIQSVDLGIEPFPLHPELAREPWRPDLCMFGCIGAPGVGGQTNLCDGIAIVEALPDDLVAKLTERKLMYIRPANPELLEFWLGSRAPTDSILANPPPTCPYWFRRNKKQIFRGFSRPVFEPTLFQRKPAFANFLLFARDYLQTTRTPVLDDGSVFPDDWLDIIRSAARSLTYAHRWHSGDVLIADNSRFMHGRRAIVQAEERRIATYFGYLKGVGKRELDPEGPVWRKDNFVPPQSVDS